MKNFFVCLLALSALAAAPVAKADTQTYSFSFTDGFFITTSGSFTVTPDANFASNGAYDITSITGIYADTQDGISGTITGLMGDGGEYANPEMDSLLYQDFDNLFYPNGTSPAGADFDNYGLGFFVNGGLINNGADAILYAYNDGAPTYQIVDATSPSNQGGDIVFGADTLDSSVSPEPGSLLLMGTGLALMGFLLYRRSQSAAPALML